MRERKRDSLWRNGRPTPKSTKFKGRRPRNVIARSGFVFSTEASGSSLEGCTWGGVEAGKTDMEIVQANLKILKR